MIQYTDEYEAKYNDRFFGKRRAVVADNNDPDKLGRVKVRNRELFGNSMSAWATPCMPFFGGRDSGFFSVPPVGSCVWLEFEEGLIDHPIYTGGFFPTISDGHSSDGSPVEEEEGFQSEKSSVPAHARGEYDGSDFGGLKGNYGLPPSEFEGEYGKVTLLQTPGGHMLELDDTDGGERIQIHHSKGSHIEILQDGSINVLSEGNILMFGDKVSDISEGDRVSNIGTNKTTTIGGDFSTTIGGDSQETIGGNTTLSVGSYIFSSRADSTYTTDGVLSMSASNLLNISSGGDMNQTVFGDVFMSSLGDFRIVSLNAAELIQGFFISPSVNIIGQNGTTRVVSEDQAGILVYGMEARGGASGQVFIGNLSEPFGSSSSSVGPIPLTKEPLVMGLQLSAYLTQLNTVLTNVATGLIATPFASVSGAGTTLLSGVAGLSPQVATLNTTSTFVSP